MIEWAVIILFVVFAVMPAMVNHHGMSYKDSLILGSTVILVILTVVTIFIVIVISVMHVAFDTKSLHDTYLLIIES